MESILLYLFKVNIAFAILYGLYKLFLTRDTFFNLRRFVLLAICILSLTYPFVEISTIKNKVGDTTILSYAYNIFLPEVIVVENGKPEIAAAQGPLSNIIFILYIVGMSLLLFRSVMEIGHILKTRKKSRKQQFNNISVYIHGKKTEPFSFMNWIFLCPENYTEIELQEIMIHENTHARQWHSLDIIFIQLIILFNWFNPFVWLLRSEMRINHEYLADRNVISAGFNKKSYQYLLIGLTTSATMAAANLYNNFSVLPLKNRLKMLNKKETSNIMITKYLMFIPAFFLLLVFSNCTETNGDGTEKTYGINGEEELIVVGYGINDDEKQDAVEGDWNVVGEIYEVPDVLPEYPGGVNELMQFLARNIRYPDPAQEEGAHGRVTVSMVIDKEGRIGNVEVLKSIHPLLDAEAIRVIKELPTWTPAQKNGSPVNVKYTIPVIFRLQ